MAEGSKWYSSSWGENGFLANLKNAMEDVGGFHDIWQINGQDITEYPEFGGQFGWYGLPDGQSRGQGAELLAKYLNAISKLTDEPLRIIAHSHGCNVVKLASSMPELDPDVHIDAAVFLACPHFYEIEYTQKKPRNWMDKFDRDYIKLKPTGRRFRYKLSPERFNAILNLYTLSDDVQVNLAQTLSGGNVYLPTENSIWQNMKKMLNTGMIETPQAERIEPDKDAKYLYENLEIQMQPGCGGIESHSAMHGAAMGALSGLWLNSPLSIDEIQTQLGTIQPVNCDDNGE